MARTTADILSQAEDTLKTAELGLNDLIDGSPDRRLAGLRNAVVFGRAVTNVIQNLRRVEPEFDSWYEPLAESLKSDPVMRFFYALRSRILKEGSIGVAGAARIDNLRLPEDAARFGPPPPNAIGFFVGDASGGAGWKIQLPDGTVEKYYIEFPSDIGSVESLFLDAPENYGTRAVNELTARYVSQMAAILQAARRRFLPS